MHIRADNFSPQRSYILIRQQRIFRSHNQPMCDISENGHKKFDVRYTLGLPYGTDDNQCEPETGEQIRCEDVTKAQDPARALRWNQRLTTGQKMQQNKDVECEHRGPPHKQAEQELELVRHRPDFEPSFFLSTTHKSVARTVITRA